MRLFFAVEVPADIKANIVEAQARLASLLPDKAFRLVRPEMLHVTLAFIGEVCENNLEEVQRRAEELCANVAPTHLVFEDLGAFPSWKQPKVLWIGAEEKGYSPFDQHAPLALLGHLLGKACLELGDHEPEKQVLLHVTIARSKNKLKKDQLSQIAELAFSSSWTNFGETEASSVVLFQSTTEKSGTVQHIPLARFPLRG